MKISALVGTRELVDYIKDYKLTERGNHQHDNICFDLVRAYHNQEIREEKKSTLEEFITPKNEQNATWEALDLILKLLSLDFVVHPLFRKYGSQPRRPSSIPSSTRSHDLTSLICMYRSQLPQLLSVTIYHN